MNFKNGDRVKVIDGLPQSGSIVNSNVKYPHVAILLDSGWIKVYHTDDLKLNEKENDIMDEKLQDKENDKMDEKLQDKYDDVLSKRYTNLAKMLGVEIGEDFYLNSGEDIYNILDNGLFCNSIKSRVSLNVLLDSEITKVPFQPNLGETFFYPVIDYPVLYQYYTWSNNDICKRIQKYVGIFRTAQEASAKAKELWNIE